MKVLILSLLVVTVARCQIPNTSSQGTGGNSLGSSITLNSPANITSSISLAGSTSVPLGSTYYGLQVNQYGMPVTLGEALGLAWPNGSIVSLVDTPSSASGAGSLGQGYAAFIGYARSGGAFTWPTGGGSATSDFRGECFVAAANGACWGITLQVGDSNQAYSNTGATNFAASGVIGMEIDLTPVNAGTTRAANIFLVNNSPVQAVQYQDGILMESEVGSICGNPATSPCLGWTNAIQIVGGSATIGLTIGELATSANQNAMPIYMIGRDASNTQRIGVHTVDNNGAPLFYAANNAATTTLGFSFFKLGTTAALFEADSLGNAEHLGSIFSAVSFVNKTDTISATWTAANVINTVIHESASAGVTITLPAAASVITQIQANGLGCYTGLGFTTKIQNIGSNPITIQGNTGTTLSNGTNAGSTITFTNGTTPITLTWEVSSCGSNTISVFQT